MSLPLFDPPTITSPSAACDDVRRIIEAKAGPFREVRDGVVIREYRILELHSGAFVFEFDDGSRVAAPAAISRTFISDGLHCQTMREFR